MNLEEIALSSASGEYRRKAWYLPAVSEARMLGIFLDAELYLEPMEAPATLEMLQRSGEIPPIACLFVSRLDGEARHYDYTCSEAYSEFVAIDLLRWLRERSGVSEESGHLLAGVSLSGLQVAYTSLKHPGIFSSVLSHSGSFWWQREWLARQVPGFPRNSSRYWLSVGTKEDATDIHHPPTGLHQELDQISGVRNFADALRARGNEVHYHLYEDGHRAEPWKAELPDALRWLLDK
ncbi:alpha/beta hydrolase [Luteolibacter luteus]|uniref:Esterase family protein n=1 Tax=Luteolibacter luteus TaxID=2728835 RepID=A0A858RKU2_9BACT|nr:alpha/beta hydrolase-fold protein [Luteolibacter luteus]QJE96810.1 esterase family protein [Luteolibacter luteus]